MIISLLITVNTSSKANIIYQRAEYFQLILNKINSAETQKLFLPIAQNDCKKRIQKWLPPKKKLIIIIDIYKKTKLSLNFSIYRGFYRSMRINVIQQFYKVAVNVSSSKMMKQLSKHYQLMLIQRISINLISYMGRHLKILLINITLKELMGYSRQLRLNKIMASFYQNWRLLNLFLLIICTKILILKMKKFMLNTAFIWIIQHKYIKFHIQKSNKVQATLVVYAKSFFYSQLNIQIIKNYKIQQNTLAALLIVTPLNELSYKVTLLNELFNFNLNDSNGEQQQKIHPSNNAKQRLKSIQLKTSQLERMNRQMTTNGRNSEKNDHKFLINALQDSIKRFFDERNSKLELSFCDYIPCARGKKQQLISYSMNKINNSLDITYIVKKLQEIDKLKMILLSPDQIKLFDFLPKPNIDLNSNNKLSYFSILKSEQSELEKAIEAQTAFNNLAKFKDDQINQHLVEFLDDDIIQLFRINMKKEIKSLTNFSPVIDNQIIKIYFYLNKESTFYFINTQTHFLSELPSRMPQIEQQDDSGSESSPSIRSIEKGDQ